MPKIKSKDIIRLMSGPYLMVNKEFLKKLGINEAIWLSDMISKYRYFKKKKMIDKQGYFYNTQQNIETDTGLNKYHQKIIIKKLKEMKIIKVKKIGLPAKNYYKINIGKLIKTLYSGSRLNPNPLLSKPLTNIYNKNKENKKNTSFFQKEVLSSTKVDEPINLFNLDKFIDDLIDYWNGKGKPFIQHKKDSKIIEKTKIIVSRLLKSKKYSTKDIYRSIDTYYEYLTDPYSNIMKCVPINDFFQLSQNSERLLRKNKITKITKSWFKECLKSKELLDRKYCKKDPNNLLTEKLMDAYEDNIGDFEFNIQNRNTFRYASRKAKEFYKDNKNRFIETSSSSIKTPLSLINYIFKALLDKKDKKKIHPGWLITDFFWNEILPDYLNKTGYME